MTCYRLVQVRWKVFGLLLESRVRLHVIDAPFIPSDLFSTAALTALCLACGLALRLAVIPEVALLPAAILMHEGTLVLQLAARGRCRDNSTCPMLALVCPFGLSSPVQRCNLKSPAQICTQKNAYAQ